MASFELVCCVVAFVSVELRATQEFTRRAQREPRREIKEVESLDAASSFWLKVFDSIKHDIVFNLVDAPCHSALIFASRKSTTFIRDLNHKHRHHRYSTLHYHSYITTINHEIVSLIIPAAFQRLYKMFKKDSRLLLLMN